MNRTDAPVLPGVTFEVERFEWTADGRLELVGRWFGLRGQRFLRPTLDVDVSGERRRMLADLEHKPWAAEDGQDWIAEFRWRGEPAHFVDAELTVSPDLAVQLPQPDNSVAEADVPTGAERVPARPPRTVLLEAELATAAEELRRVTGELTNLRDEHAEARQAAAEELEKAKQERDAAAAAHAEALGAMQRERDEARERLAAVEHERDEVRERLAGAEAERQAAADARDEARAERNAWMSRARAAALPPAPTPESEPPAPPAEPPRSEGHTTGDLEPRAGDEPEARAGEQSLPRASEELEPDRSDDETAPVDAPVALFDSAREEGVGSDSPRQERRTIRIGERPFPAPPGPVHAPMHQGGWRQFLDAWGPRLAALAALIVFLAVVALVLTWAL